MPSLFVIRGNDQGTRFELAEPILRLGRDASNLIQIHDTEVSRHHAELRRSDDDFILADLDSSNGTFVNGQRVRSHRLASGDQIQIGATLMLYTGPPGEGGEDLVQSVNIAAAALPEDQSRIIHSVTQQEGSKVFDSQAELPKNSWLARAAAISR